MLPILGKFCFRARSYVTFGIIASFRRSYWSTMGMSVGRGTALPHICVSWPHQVRLGCDCRIESDVTFKFDGPWRSGPSIIIGDRVFLGRACEFNVQGSVAIGDDALIGSGCKFIDHDHQLQTLVPIAEQPCDISEIVIEEGAWLGVNVIVLKGVLVGRGAVVAAGAVVTRSIPPFEIWAGVPARRLSTRTKATA